MLKIQGEGRRDGRVGRAPSAPRGRAPSPAGRSRRTLPRHAERTSHGGVTQTKQPPGNPARFKHVKPQSRKCVLEQRRKWVTRPLAGSDGQREASARASRMLPVRCAASVQTEIGTRPSNRMSRSMPRPSGGRTSVISTRLNEPSSGSPRSARAVIQRPSHRRGIPTNSKNIS